MSITSSHRERPPPHLSPKKASKTEHTSVKAQTEQANEHDEKQDYIGNEGCEDVGFAADGVRYIAGVLGRGP